MKATKIENQKYKDPISLWLVEVNQRLLNKIKKLFEYVKKKNKKK